MEYLDLKLLKRCCRPDVTQMDELETGVVNEILVQYLVLDLNVSRIMHCLYTAEYIQDDIYKNIKRHFDRLTFRNELTTNRRVLVYMTSKISFVALLWSLSKCGYQRFANLLLTALERQRNSTISLHVQKAPVKRCSSIYVLVKQLKGVSDSRIIPNPVAFIRRLAMLFRERFIEETDISKKGKLADKYFAVLSVETDNFSFMKNNFVSVKALMSEIRRIIPFTSNPVFGKRRKMMFHLASGRMMHLKGMDIEAVAYLTKAMDLALEGGFVESQSFSDYMKNISQQEDVI